MKVLLTGSSGFIGRHVCKALSNYEVQIITLSRSKSYENSLFAEESYREDLQSISEERLLSILHDIDFVIHCAGQSSVDESDKESINRSYAINVMAVQKLASAAKRSGVKRFILLSSIKVNGEATSENILSENSAVAPEGVYANHKAEAEECVTDTFHGSSTDWVIVRPPIVYGQGASGAVRGLLLLNMLPVSFSFKQLENIRASIGVSNLADFIAYISVSNLNRHSLNRSYVITDKPPLSLNSLVARFNEVGANCFTFGRPVIDLSKAINFLLSKNKKIKFLSCLKVNSDHIHQLTDWSFNYAINDDVQSSFLLNRPVIRIADILISIIGLCVACPFMLMILVSLFVETSHPLYTQQRIGANGREFTIFKFRTMRIDAPSLPSHLVDAKLITPVGRFLRRYKLDELPQLINVFRGDMSMVGPRPALPEQKVVHVSRSKNNLLHLRPGLTGCAQISKIDMSEPYLLAKLDRKTMEGLSLKSYFRIILNTILGSGSGDAAKN